MAALFAESLASIHINLRNARARRARAQNSTFGSEVSEMQEPDVQEHKTPLLEVKLQRPIVIRTVSDC